MQTVILSNKCISLTYLLCNLCCENTIVKITHSFVSTVANNSRNCNLIGHVGSYDSVCMAEFLISFESWAKLAQQWLVCVPFGIHLEPINKELMLFVTI